MSISEIIGKSLTWIVRNFKASWRSMLTLVIFSPSCQRPYALLHKQTFTCKLDGCIAHKYTQTISHTFAYLFGFSRRPEIELWWIPSHQTWCPDIIYVCIIVIRAMWCIDAHLMFIYRPKSSRPVVDIFGPHVDVRILHFTMTYNPPRRLIIRTYSVRMACPWLRYAGSMDVAGVLRIDVTSCHAPCWRTLPLPRHR